MSERHAIDADDARLLAISGRVQLAGADFMIEIQQAQTWGALALTLAELEKALEYLGAIRDAGLARENGLAQP